MANGDGVSALIPWVVRILTGILLLAVSGMGWVVRDTRDTMLESRERLSKAEVKVEHNESGITKVEASISSLQSRMDNRFDELMKELRDAGRE